MTDDEFVELPAGRKILVIEHELSAILSQQAEFAVDRGGGALQARQPVDHLDGDGLAGDREVLDGLGRLAAPQLFRVRHLLS